MNESNWREEYFANAFTKMQMERIPEERAWDFVWPAKTDGRFYHVRVYDFMVDAINEQVDY